VAALGSVGASTLATELTAQPSGENFLDDRRSFDTVVLVIVLLFPLIALWLAEQHITLRFGN